MDKLERLRLRLRVGGEEANELILLLLSEAEEFILAYTGRGFDQWVEAFDSVQGAIAVINYNRLGAEGYKSRNEGTIATNFLGEADYPAGVMRVLDRHRIVRWGEET